MEEGTPPLRSELEGLKPTQREKRALAAGATVFGTASTPEKREYLESLGVAQTFNSRDLGFVEGVRTATKGRGVDLVLNSLAGVAMMKSIELLAPFGHFVEIGKRGIWSKVTG